MRQRILAVMAGLMVVSACTSNQEGSHQMAPLGDADSKLFLPTLPSPEEMARGSAPLEYRTLVDNHLDRVLSRPQPRTVDYKARPYGGLACGTIDFTSETNQEIVKGPFVVVFNQKGGLESLELYRADDVRAIKSRHSSNSPDQATINSYFALEKCGFI